MLVPSTGSNLDNPFTMCCVGHHEPNPVAGQNLIFSQQAVNEKYLKYVIADVLTEKKSSHKLFPEVISPSLWRALNVITIAKALIYIW